MLNQCAQSSIMKKNSKENGQNRFQNAVELMIYEFIDLYEKLEQTLSS